MGCATGRANDIKEKPFNVSSKARVLQSHGPQVEGPGIFVLARVEELLVSPLDFVLLA